MGSIDAFQINRMAKACALALPVMFASATAGATDFTAGIVMTKMQPSDRFPFVAGIVEGLSYARYMRDGQSTESMKCVYDWFYGTENRIEEVYEAFNKFPDYLPGAVVAAMVQKECGA